MSTAERRVAERSYTMRRRAENVDDTRRRIVEATVALHGSVGPSGTTFKGVAERAGVTRATVYRHFPDDDALFTACSAHWLAQQLPPDPAAWLALEDPLERVGSALSDLYRFYRGGEPMLRRIYRDLEFVPTRHRRGLRARDDEAAQLLLAAFTPRLRRQARLRAVIGHAVSFHTWCSLCVEQGLDNANAVRVMLDLVAATARRP